MTRAAALTPARRPVLLSPVAARITVAKEAEGRFLVTVDEGGSRTSHAVTVDGATRDRLTGGKHSAEELVRRSFEFLLEREGKEDILREFALPVIGRYFPEYEREVQRRLKGP